ncbi:MAG TPA: hypothetical protein DCO79_01910 [Spirochaeta sp.]|nr:hypothetical protein [Spirochaeta sp.]
MKIIAFDGSPRKNSNSAMMLKAFIKKLEEGDEIKYYKTDDLDLQPCRGCVMCNALKSCIIRKDYWQVLSKEILEADVLAFSSPIYFHHTTSSMKKLIDRFRSFINVQITEDGIIHRPHENWSKKFFLFTAHGSSSTEDAQPLVDLFNFIIESLGDGNELKYINAVRLAASGQIRFNEERLKQIYGKLGLPENLASEDLKKNEEWLKTAEHFAEELYV